MELSRKQLVTLAVICGGFIILLIILAILNAHQHITVSYDTSKYTSVTLYKGTDSKDEKTIAPTRTVAQQSVESGKDYFLPKGSYYLIAKSDNNTVSTRRQGIVLDSEKKSISLPYDYTQAYLKQLTNKEQSAIDQAITQSNSTISSLYTIKSHAVLEKGNWAVSALAFKGSGTDLNRDTLKVVLQKQDTKWRIACSLKISISKYECNNAPQSVLDAANMIDITTQQPLMPNYTLDQPRQRGGSADV